ncbi:MAG: phosphoadenosine phosphosulfate reductase family protein [Candidatus Aminicenantes bacterium]|nr:phosphoadenosine phosphosulfate reductase family protein [Candidatus Aminicenantes bacterium]
MSVTTTLKTIQKYSNNGMDVVVNFSGGRYSLVLLHLALRALGKVKAVYVDTTISLPECNEFVEEICEAWGVELIVLKRKDVDFWDLVKRRGFPHHRFRWCMKEFKSVPLRLLSQSFDGELLHLVGTSKHESSFRKKVYDIRGMYHYNYSIRAFCLHPMLEWTENMVYKYLEYHNIPLNPCYEKYYNSGNCYYCPYVSSMLYYSKLASLQPKLFSKIVDAEKAMRNGGGAIYLGRGKVLHLSKLVSLSVPKNVKLPSCEKKAMAKTLYTCQKRCLM